MLCEKNESIHFVYIYFNILFGNVSNWKISL